MPNPKELRCLPEELYGLFETIRAKVSSRQYLDRLNAVEWNRNLCCDDGIHMFPIIISVSPETLLIRLVLQMAYSFQLNLLLIEFVCFMEHVKYT